MSLTASMWTSVTGLLAHGEKMNVIGDNIANVNTIGFKGSRMDFQDFVHQTVNAATGPAQVGRGVSIGAIYGDFIQGAFETTNDPTDLAINGNGFFKVVPKNSSDAYYTRAGNFRFDAQGYLVDPHGYVVQGWEVETVNSSMASGTATGSSQGSRIVGTGVPKDVRLESFSCDPHHTSNISWAINLDSDSGTEKATSNTGNPFISLFNNWDATTNANGKIDPPLGNDGFAYQQSITVYDESGTSHVLTIYFDQVQSDVTNGDPSKRYWEYIATMDPAEDERVFAGGGTVPAGDVLGQVPEDKRGILMAGTMTFNTGGELVDMSAYVPTKGGTGAGGFDDPDTWVAAPISSNGYPLMAPNFTGRNNASDIWDPAATATPPTATDPGTINPEVRGYMIELNMGYSTTTDWWNGGSLTLGGVDTDASQLGTFGTSGMRGRPATTSYAGNGNGKNFFERYANQDGYTYGELSSISVNSEGVMVGRYSNGVSLELFQLTLYNFSSLTNLHREGGNLFSQTRESGDPTSGAANTGGFGAVYSNSIEQSNVDLAREFVQMITTQRGFQANSKSITTTDSMLETVVNMKR